MKSKIQVINVEQVSGTSKNGPYAFQKLHCIVDQPDGTRIVGVLVPPKGIDNVVPGDYEAEFGLSVDREQRIIGSLKVLSPVAVVKPVKAGAGAF